MITFLEFLLMLGNCKNVVPRNDNDNKPCTSTNVVKISPVTQNNNNNNNDRLTAFDPGQPG